MAISKILLFNDKGDLIWKFWSRAGPPAFKPKPTEKRLNLARIQFYSKLPPTEAKPFYDAILSDNGKYLVLHTILRTVRLFSETWPVLAGSLYYLDDIGREIWRYQLPSEISDYGVSLSADGRYLAVPCTNGIIYFFDCWGSNNPPKAKPAQKPVQ